MRITKNMVGVIFLMTLFLIFSAGAAHAGPINGGTYFTKVNIWYEKPNNIPSTNYHKGALIPFATKTTLKDLGKNEIIFKSDIGSFTIVFIPKHSSSGMSITDIFNQYFSEQDASQQTPYINLSDMEKEQIKRGEIAAGMSKEAVLIAYGNPPSHVTPSLKADSWTYWESRFVKLIVQFENNRVIHHY